MTHDLLHADLVAAVADNVFVLIGMPMLAAWILLRRRRHKAVLPLPAVITVSVATVAWAVLRNLPGFPLVPTLVTG